MKGNIFLNHIKSRILAEDKNAFLILFGSKARGDDKQNSDWDLLILISKKQNSRI